MLFLSSRSGLAHNDSKIACRRPPVGRLLLRGVFKDGQKEAAALISQNRRQRKIN